MRTVRPFVPSSMRCTLLFLQGVAVCTCSTFGSSNGTRQHVRMLAEHACLVFFVRLAIRDGNRGSQWSGVVDTSGIGRTDKS